MTAPKPPRPIATDVGTSDRIEADQGHYWVRLWSKQAMLREGAALKNCLEDGAYEYLAGDDDPRERSLWSLRDAEGRSIALAEYESESIDEFLEPVNNMPSPLAYRQLQHLRTFYASLEVTLCFDLGQEPVVVGPDGATYRWDKAPPALRRPDHDQRMKERLQEAERKRRARQRLADVTGFTIDLPPGEPPAGMEMYAGTDVANGPAVPVETIITRHVWAQGRNCEQEDATRWANLYLAEPYRPSTPPPLPDPGYVERLAHALGIPKEQNAALVAECIEALEGDRPASQAPQPILQLHGYQRGILDALSDPSARHFVVPAPRNSSRFGDEIRALWASSCRDVDNIVAGEGVIYDAWEHGMRDMIRRGAGL